VPVISVVIPAFRVEATIARAVRSVVDQTIDDWEAIIVADDGMDYTAILRRSGIDDPRLRFVSTGRVGSGCHHARNAGLVKAHGDFIADLDADDLFLPSRLATLLPLAQRQGAVADNVRVVDDATGDVICHAFSSDFSCRSLDAAALLDASVPLFPLVARQYARPRMAGIEFGEDVVANLCLIDRIGSLTVIGASLSDYRVVRGSLCHRDDSAENFERSYSDLIERLARGDRLGLSPANAAQAHEGLLRKRELNRAFASARRENEALDFQTFAARRRGSTVRQNGISSSMSSRLPPAPAIAGLRSRDAVGPAEPNSPSSEPAPPPARSSMVSAELKPCSTTSVE
jgi:succinoglycan biosynthesis protein ExoO